MNKSIIAWVGGKAKLMWLINLLAPTDYERSIDVFGGSATVTLNLDGLKSNLKIYNDFNGNLVNLMRCARDKPLALLKEIGFLTLNSRDDFETYKNFFEKTEFTENDLFEELELTEIMFEAPTDVEVKLLYQKREKEKDVKRASIFYKLMRYSYNSNGESFGAKKCDVRSFSYSMWCFYRAFADVVIENKDFESLIKQHDRPKAFIYCDPPYLEAEDVYEAVFTKEDHKRLHDTLTKAQGYVMVSYNNSEEIRNLYKDFYIFYTTRPNSMSHKPGDLYEELIMTNYNPKEFVASKSYQMQLFDETEVFDSNYKLIHEPIKESDI